MRSLLTALSLIMLSGLLESCQKCYTCSVQTDFGQVDREVCGRNRDIKNLITHLETDSVGYGPWICE
ncbi:MAG: hypothetical protein HN542_10765 [Flavobacteriales bacterium]|nr:hypothetical protein [Flavobacteriales bacterium]NCG30695.1 hypothetical protein [Bacteroidota bacterium]MBT3962734.1 hypothetical protein [Flavobacteriales bacterium]MBT4703981.1 hypothetical protein [Flavobacteriales bacterium]MBT4930323.1 hypothetical protein [Flavobacteriales bacterium]